MFRSLKPNEIEVRVQQCKANGCILLLYKDARCDMNILDATVTPLGWKREHLRDNKNCVVSIWNKEINQWISKEDTGTESNTEQQKGLASDSFKRACFNWGIGRELYTAPFTWVNLDKSEVSEYNGKFKLGFKTKFRVSDITIDDNHQITDLKIVDQNNKIRFSMNNNANNRPKEPLKQYSKPVDYRKEIFNLLESGKLPTADKENYIAKFKSDSSLLNEKTVKEIKSKYFA